jgi:hypothetical protein
MTKSQKLPRISKDAKVQAAYAAMRRAGESHTLAEMLALKRFPGVKSDSVWNEGRCNGNQFEKCPALGDHYRRVAESEGVSIVGKTYLSGLADYPGDPRAWVSDRHDVLAIAKERNYTCRGYVEHEGHDVEPMPDVPIAPELVEREVAEILAADPGANRDAVTDTVIRKRTGQLAAEPEYAYSGMDQTEEWACD